MGGFVAGEFVRLVCVRASRAQVEESVLLEGSSPQSFCDPFCGSWSLVMPLFDCAFKRASEGGP